MMIELGRLYIQIGTLTALSGHPKGIHVFLRKRGKGEGRFAPWTVWEWWKTWGDSKPQFKCRPLPPDDTLPAMDPDIRWPT